MIDCTFEEFKWVAWVIRSRWVIAVDPSLTKDFDVPWLEITGKTLSCKTELVGPFWTCGRNRLERTLLIRVSLKVPEKELETIGGLLDHGSI